MRKINCEEDVAPTNKPVPPPTPAVPDAAVPVVPVDTHDAPPPPPLSVNTAASETAGSNSDHPMRMLLDAFARPFCAGEEEGADRTCTASALPVDGGVCRRSNSQSPFTKTTTRLVLEVNPIAHICRSREAEGGNR